MRRKLFTLASAVSLVLLVGTVVLWVRSHWASDYFSIAIGQGNVFQAGYLTGSVFVCRARLSAREASLNTYPPIKVEDITQTSIYGFGLFENQAAGVIVPFWLPILLFGSLPVVLRGSRSARADSSMQRCTKCGYDLRATPDRCPECGTPVPVRRATA